MTRQGEALRLSEELLADIELSRCGPQELLLKARRLARLVADDEAGSWLGFELVGYPQSSEGWSSLGRMGRLTSNGESGSSPTGYTAPPSELLAISDATKGSVSALQGVSVSGEMLIPALREQRQFISSCAEVISRIGKISGRVVQRIHEFTSRVNFELQFSQLQAELFEVCREETDSKLAPLTGNALEKVESISARLRDRDPEAVSAAMNTCRRLIDSLADFVFPPSDQNYRLGDHALAVDQSKPLNRIAAFLHAQGVSDGRRSRLRRSLADLYERSSAGVHADVSVDEARFIFLQTYVVLGEILTLPATPDGVA